jgi:hypothetical protein
MPVRVARVPQSVPEVFLRYLQLGKELGASNHGGGMLEARETFTISIRPPQ